MSRRRPLAEVLLVFAAATAVISALFRLRGIRFIDQYISVMAAVVFLYLPAAVLWRQGKELDEYGFTLAGLRRALLAFAGACAVVFPLFVLGYAVYVARICPRLPAWLAMCPPHPSPGLRWPPEPLTTALGQLLVVAMPEEFFFRGYVQGRLAEKFSRAPAIALSSLLFALGHVLVSFEPGSLMVFFPGLVFGLLRAATGSIVAGTLFHASCNVLIDVLHRSLG